MPCTRMNGRDSAARAKRIYFAYPYHRALLFRVRGVAARWVHTSIMGRRPPRLSQPHPHWQVTVRPGGAHALPFDNPRPGPLP
jgi:hypothetical protein